MVKFQSVKFVNSMFRYTLVLSATVLVALFMQDFHLVAWQWQNVTEYVSFAKWAILFESLPSQAAVRNDEFIFSAEDLKKYTDLENGLYLAILGEVFDVSRGSKYYAPGEGYHFFTGRDGSRAFVTGDFTEAGLQDDVLDLNSQDLSGLSDWLNFYKRDYIHKGVLIGRYYDTNGNPTEYKLQIKERLEIAKEQQTEGDKEKLLFPPCNVEWNPEMGSRVWCSNMSGGIKRKWIGVPRKLYTPGSDSFRCACVNLETAGRHMKTLGEYPNCNPRSSSCHIEKM